MFIELLGNDSQLLTEEPIKSTLDEPITITLKRDLDVIFTKIKYVIVPPRPFTK